MSLTPPEARYARTLDLIVRFRHAYKLREATRAVYFKSLGAGTDGDPKALRAYEDAVVAWDLVWKEMFDYEIKS